MVTNNFSSHISLNGDKPYHRYAVDGRSDHVSENLMGFDAQDGNKFSVGDSEVQELLMKIHAEILNEEPPQNKNKENLLSTEHTHVAIGVAVDEHRLRYVEVYTDRYVKIVSCPQSLTSPDFTISGQVLNPEYGAYVCSVFYDPPAAPLTAAEAQSSSQTSFLEYSDSKAAVVWPWDMTVQDDGSFEVPINLPKLEPGRYFIQLHLKKGRETIPYKSYVEGVNVPAEDTVCATGMVIGYDGETQLGQTIGGGNEVEKMESRTSMQSSAISPINYIEVITGPLSQLSKEPAKDGHELTEILSEAGGSGDDAPSFMLRYRRQPLDSEEFITSPPITDVKLVVSTPPEVGAEDGGAVELNIPEGYEALTGNIYLTSAAAAEGVTTTQAVLCVQRGSLAEREPVIDLALGVFDSLAEQSMQSSMATSEFAKLPSPPFESGASLMVKLASPGESLNEGDDAYLPSFAEGDDDQRELDPDELKRLEMEAALEEARLREEAEAREAEAMRLQNLDHLRGLLAEAKEEKERLLLGNTSLQKRLVPFLVKKADSAASAAAGSVGQDRKEEKNTAESEKRYSDSLSYVNDARTQLNKTQAQYDRVAMDLQLRLDDKEEQAKKILESFREFKRDIAKGAENSRTGKPIPDRIVRQFEATEKKKDQDVEKVRLKNINLRTQLRKIEQQLRAKEQLAEGLHLIDFEQLKIENQTLNEKIEERNEELHKLRKKTTTTVQVLTHIKEKLQFVQGENGQLKHESAALDIELTRERDGLTKSKRERDRLRKGNSKLKQRQGFVNSDLLVQDFEQRKVDMEALSSRLQELKDRQRALLGSTNVQTGISQ